MEKRELVGCRPWDEVDLPPRDLLLRHLLEKFWAWLFELFWLEVMALLRLADGSKKEVGLRETW